MTKEESTNVLGDVRAYLSSRATLENEIFAGHTFIDICNAIKTVEQEPKYCDRNICISNEYNGIGCDKCEVTKSQEKTSLTNKEWVDLISENFGVSRSIAKEMLHNMLNTPKYKYGEERKNELQNKSK